MGNLCIYVRGHAMVNGLHWLCHKGPNFVHRPFMHIHVPMHSLHVFSFWWTPIFIIKGCVWEFYSLIVILLWEMHQNIHMDVLDIWFICPKFWFSHIIDCRKALLSMGNVGGIELLMSWKVCMGSFF